MRKVLFIFGQLKEQDVDWLARSGMVEDIAAEETLISEGTEVDSVYVVLDGLLEVTVAALGSESIDRVQVGDILGEMSFIDASPPSASVTATVDSRVLRIPRRRLADKLDQDPEMAARFYRAVAMLLSDRLRESRGQRADALGLASTGKLGPVELDPNVLDSVSQAGERFDRLLRGLEQAGTR